MCAIMVKATGIPLPNKRHWRLYLDHHSDVCKASPFIPSLWNYCISSKLAELMLSIWRVHLAWIFFHDHVNLGSFVPGSFLLFCHVFSLKFYFALITLTWKHLNLCLKAWQILKQIWIVYSKQIQLLPADLEFSVYRNDFLKKDFVSFHFEGFSSK